MIFTVRLPATNRRQLNLHAVHSHTTRQCFSHVAAVPRKARCRDQWSETRRHRECSSGCEAIQLMKDRKHSVTVYISVLLSRWLSSLCSYEWHYNGRHLDTSNLSSSTYYVHNASVDGSLHIKTWSASTQGYYHCHAVNTAGVTM